jgi:Lon protease-like protein
MVTPMFPLGTVLFPHMPLDLRIFEPRYLKLLGDLLEDDTEPEFGVVLIERGQEVGGDDQRFGFGTMARINQVSANEQFYFIETIGTQRFKITDWQGEDPYPQAEIEPLPDLEWDDALYPSRVHVEKQVRKLLSFASEFTELRFPADTELDQDPLAAAWQMASMLPMGQLDQMDLLQSESAEELLSQTYELAVAGEQQLQQMIQREED